MFCSQNDMVPLDDPEMIKKYFCLCFTLGRKRMRKNSDKRGLSPFFSKTPLFYEKYQIGIKFLGIYFLPYFFQFILPHCCLKLDTEKWLFEEEKRIEYF